MLLCSGAVETLIVWENLTTLRYELKKPSSEQPVVRVSHVDSCARHSLVVQVIFVRPDQEADKTLFIDPEVAIVEHSRMIVSFIFYCSDQQRNGGPGETAADRVAGQ